MKRTIIAVVLSLALSPIVASAGQLESPNIFVQVLDLVLVRPLSLGITAISTVGCVIATPILLATDSVYMGYDIMVSEPIEYTFSRPLGQW